MAEHEDLRFPLDIGTEDLFTDNIIQFSIHDFAAGGYNKPSANSKESANKPNTVTKPKGKLTHKIYLPISSAPNSNYTANWRLGSPNVVANAAIDTFNESGSISDNIKGVILSNVFDRVSKYLSKNQGTMDTFQSTGFTIQPYQENLFENISFRGFNFNFKLIPRNEKELKECSKIVLAFKRAVVPSIAGAKDIGGVSGADITSAGIRVFNSPSVFYIKYIIMGDQGAAPGESSSDDPLNEWLPRFHPCICNSVDVVYGGDGRNYVSFAETKGAPVYYDIKLRFTELTYVTKENIDQGY